MRDSVILLGWFLVTAILNYMMRTRTAAEWEELARSNPRYAAVARMLRAVGLDPVKLIQSVIDFVRGESQKRIGNACDKQATCGAKCVEPKADDPKASKTETAENTAEKDENSA